MKLWIDDIRNAPDESWTVARSVDSAISFISQFGEELTEISIDHDISHQVAMGERSSPYPCAETFTAVARYMSAYYGSLMPNRPGFTRPKVTVHSSNQMGAKNIEYILRDFPDVTYKPYGPANRLEQTI